MMMWVCCGRFEEFLKLKWPSEKRFGLEGCEVSVNKHPYTVVVVVDLQNAVYKVHFCKFSYKYLYSCAVYLQCSSTYSVDMSPYIPSLSNQVYEGYRCMDLITVHTHCLVKYTLKCFIHYALIHLFA